MKKIFTFFAALCTMGVVMAQTPTLVSTNVEKRNVLIEEFTGVGCGYCPDGHARANQICQQYEGHAWAINIHQGSYATGSGYETQWGDGLAGQYNITGYPCGVTNRCPNIQNRGEWAATAAQVRSEDSPVNLGAVAEINPITRQLVVNVEAYYTGSQSVTSNFLNVVLVQNNIIGPQSNYGNYNAEYITSDGQYRHMHMLRDMITGQWGEEITTISTGELVQRTYTYTLPSAIGAVPIDDFDNLEVIVFLTETHKNVITANEAAMTVLPGAYIAGFSCENEDCSFDYQPIVTLANTFDETVTSWVINYNGTEITYNKTVTTGNRDTVHLPLYTITDNGETVQNCATTLSASIVNVMKGGVVTSINSTPSTISIANFQMIHADGPFYLDLVIDRYGDETHAYWINQSNCNPLWHTPTFTNISFNKARHNYFNIDPADAGTYIFRVTDDYGDGATYVGSNGDQGFTLYSLKNGDTTVVLTHDGDYGAGIDYVIITSTSGSGTYVGIEDVADVKFSVYPNPATDRLNISCNEAVREINVIDMAGRTVISTGAERSLNVSGLATGVYMVRIATENGIGIQKFVKE